MKERQNGRQYNPARTELRGELSDFALLYLHEKRQKSTHNNSSDMKYRIEEIRSMQGPERDCGLEMACEIYWSEGNITPETFGLKQ